MESNICNSMILTSRRRHFYLVGQSKHKVGACRVNNQASSVLAGNELPFVAFNKYDVSQSRVEPQGIILKSDLSVHLRPYRTPPIQEKEIKGQVEKLLQAGLIKESNGPYSAPVTLALKHEEADHPQTNGKNERVNQPLVTRLECKRILFSDEAHFWLNDYVNKQNCRLWSEANPQVYVETPLHPEKLTVWCALWAGGILLQKR
ncbi:integrase catalytic domain-containing protein [Trichonephila clavipes]|nr:integrase catalytic domain-containing protein [Trichonephila clavipes]